MSRSVRDALAFPGGVSACDAGAAPGGVRGFAELSLDPVAGVLLAANAHGLKLLRLPAGITLPVALDAAMPAMRRLRAIAGGAVASGSENLTLWSGGQLVRVSAGVIKETMSDGRTRLVVRALHDADQSSHMAQVPPAHSDGSPAASGSSDPPPVQRDDRETLREIARRIREGHKPAANPFTEVALGDNGQPPALHAPEGANQIAAPRQERVGKQTNEGKSLPVREPAAAPDGRTLSKVAHELKTPLSAIAAAAEIMRDQQLGPMGNTKYLGYAGDIFESARHALDVINAMLTGGAHEQRSSSPVDLSALALATVSTMQPLAKASGINLEADADDERLMITGDATAVRQIIYNLVSNALKFTPHGGEVHVVTGYLPRGVPFLVVRDTGEGMSEDDIVRAFYRDDSRIGARKGGGYGIGLPMVRRLAELMCATIDVDSEPGKGTVVLVSFPNH